MIGCLTETTTCVVAKPLVYYIVVAIFYVYKSVILGRCPHLECVVLTREFL